MKNLKQTGAPLSAKKIVIKAGILIALVLLLWIPLTMIESLTDDRMYHQMEAEATIENNISQNINLKFRFAFEGKNQKSEITQYEFIADAVNIDANLEHKFLNQGRYDVLTYDAKVKYTASMSFKKEIDSTELCDTIDTSSIKLNIINWSNGEKIAEIPVTLNENGDAVVAGSFSIAGMKSLAAVMDPNTTFTVRGDWPNPDFASIGILPNERQVDDNGFSACWKSNELSGGSSAGVVLLVPVSQYQMTERTLKYGMFIIILTFAMFFITELWYKRSINIIQYLLAGLALVIFYSLLLSICEYIRFAYAYLIASAMTISLILSYLISMLGNKKSALVISLLLAVLYVYTYILTQLETYSLISGSIGLFVILAIIMYMSQRLFNHEDQNDTPSPNEGEIN